LKNKKRIEEILKIDTIGFEGKAIARNEGAVHFIKKAVPGDVLRTLRVSKKKNFYENNILEILEKSPDRIAPRCIYFDDCGGCSWQNLDYNHQLKWKKSHVEDAFVRHNKLHIPNLMDTVPSDKIFNYRNKMDFSFGASRWLTDSEIETNQNIEHKNFALGLHISGRFDKILDIKQCHIQDEIGNEILNLCRKVALKNDITAYNLRTHTGYLRSLIIRKSNYLNEFLVILITNNPENQDELNFIDEFSDALKSITQVKHLIHSLNISKNPVTIESSKVIFGQGYLKEKILDVIYEISPYSFFQTNSYQVDKFIGDIIEAVAPENEEYIWDLYCGTGSITLPLSKKVNKLIGIELVESSIEDAKRNAINNNIDNIEFIAYDLHSKDISNLLEKFPKPDKIILDPPRSGLHKNLINHLLEIKCEEIIYVSCNPMTQARDCKDLSEFYEIEFVKPFDMFPQTYHIESIAKLKLIKKIC
jgi:23S rRNA (uracil1939-C5)-methyltransferase